MDLYQYLRVGSMLASGSLLFARATASDPWNARIHKLVAYSEFTVNVESNGAGVAQGRCPQSVAP